MKVLHDNVLGPIELEDELVEIIDTPSFQRLRRLEQLGTASLVFPGARHTRFEHSLGAQEIMRRVLQRLRSNAGSLRIDCREEKLLRVAALVHDLGHYPLSHVIENVVDAIEKRANGDAGQLGIEQKDPSNSGSPVASITADITDENWWLQMASPTGAVEAGSPAHHENLTSHVLDTDANLRCAINKFIGGGDATRELIEVLKKEAPERYRRQLVSSELDVDRLDYLVRDSYYTGVSFGSVEVGHMIRRLSLHLSANSKQKIVVVDERARSHLEHYLLARHFMYSQVIYHKVVTGFAVLAGAVWIALHNGGELMTSVNAIRDSIGNGRFLSFDDTWFWQKCARMKSSGSGFAQQLAGHLLDRRSPILVLEARARGNALLGKARGRFERHRDRLAEACELDPKHLFLTDQTVRVASGPPHWGYDEAREEDYERPLVKINDTDIVPVTDIDGSIAQKLSANEDREQIIRIYCLRIGDRCDRDFARRVGEVREKFKEELDI